MQQISGVFEHITQTYSIKIVEIVMKDDGNLAK